MMTNAEILAAIDERLSQRGVSSLSLEHEENYKLWNILTALRGPDSSSDDALQLKGATTAVIRAVVFPKTATSGLRFGMAADDHDDRVRDRLNPRLASAVDSHFREHAMAAFGALGLKWDEKNGG